MTFPRVSAITPVYNGARYLAEALDSALAQSFRDFEVVVVDDGSSDDSGRIADVYAAAHPSFIRVIHQENKGLPAARNRAIDAARGEFIALLDADDTWLPHHLADAVNAMDRNPQAGLVHGNFELMDENGHSLGSDPSRWPPSELPAWERILLRLEHVMCPTAVFRRAMVDQVGPFDLGFNRLGCEDRDLWLRIAAVAPIVHLGDIHARYRMHGNNMSGQRDKMIRARLKLVDKHCSSPESRQLRRKAKAAVYLEDAYGLRRQGQFRPALEAYGRALGQQPWSWSIWKGAIAAALSHR